MTTTPIPEYDASAWEADLYDLSEQLATLDPDAQHHGLLGGAFGYGQHFRNAVFEMRPYFWGDCDCGFDDRGQPDGEYHTPQCSLELPNCRHFASGLEVRWYKYIGRGMTANRKISRKQCRDIMAQCLASIAAKNA